MRRIHLNVLLPLRPKLLLLSPGYARLGHDLSFEGFTYRMNNIFKPTYLTSFLKILGLSLPAISTPHLDLVTNVDSVALLSQNTLEDVQMKDINGES